ncbi:hypothetical protein PRNP1_012375 [Phytophthora ramorum]
MKRVSCFVGDEGDLFFAGINESSTLRDLKIYLTKTQWVPASFKLVLARDGSQSILCEEVPAETRSDQVTNRLRVVAANDEIDLTRTVRSVLGDINTWLDVDILIVPCGDVLGKRKEPPVSDNEELQSVQVLPLRGLTHVMQHITDFVGLPHTIVLAVREGWSSVVRAFGDTKSCSLDAMDEAAANGHLETVKWIILVEIFISYNTRLAVEAVDAAGQTSILDLLLRNKPEELVVAALESAARHGRLDALRYFGKEGDSPSFDADKNPHKQMNVLYHASDALGEAARAGHRDAVRWILDAIAIHPKTFDVIAKAARDGWHDVVELLCAGSTKAEMLLALDRGVSYRGSLDVIQVIYDTCAPEKLVGAAKTRLSKFSHHDQATTTFLRSVEHV